MARGQVCGGAAASSPTLRTSWKTVFASLRIRSRPRGPAARERRRGRGGAAASWPRPGRGGEAQRPRGVRRRLFWRRRAGRRTCAATPPLPPMASVETPLKPYQPIHSTSVPATAKRSKRFDRFWIVPDAGRRRPFHGLSASRPCGGAARTPPNSRRREGRPRQTRRPSVWKTTDCCGSPARQFVRGPTNFAATSAAMPPVKWTTPDPAKSITPQPPTSRFSRYGENFPDVDQPTWTTTG